MSFTFYRAAAENERGDRAQFFRLFRLFRVLRVKFLLEKMMEEFCRLRRLSNKFTF
jgi:hypothetical protein